MSLRICKGVIICSFLLLAFTACDSSDINDSSDDDNKTVVTGKFNVVFSLEDYLNNRAAWDRSSLSTYSFDLKYERMPHDGLLERFESAVAVKDGALYKIIAKEGELQNVCGKNYFKSIDELYDFIWEEYLYWQWQERPEYSPKDVTITVNYNEYNVPDNIEVYSFYSYESGKGQADTKSIYVDFSPNELGFVENLQ